MKIFRHWSLNEPRLVPVSIEDYLPAGHMAIWVRDIVFELTRQDLQNWRTGTEGGRPAYNPGMMAAVLIFAYMRGIRSSRRIQRLMAENIAFKVISGEQSPDFRTLSEFRRIHHAFFQKVFTRVILLAMQLKMIDLGAVLVDGTVLQANASKKRSRRIKALKRLEQEEMEDQKARAAQGMAQRMIQEAETADAEENRLYGQEGYPDALFASEAPAAERLDRIREAIRKVEASERKRLQRIAARRARLFRLAWERRNRNPGPGRRLKGSKRKPRRIRVKGVSKALSKFTAISVPREKRGNTTDPDSRRLTQAQTGGYVQGHRILRATDANSGIILDTTVATATGESRGLPTIVQRVMRRLGIARFLRLVVDKGFSGKPNLEAMDRLGVLETLIPQVRTSRRSVRVREAKALVAKRTYWMKKRKRIESTFGNTKENKGFRRLLLRGIRGVEIELLLDAIGINLEKIAAKFRTVPSKKIRQTLALAGPLGF